MSDMTLFDFQDSVSESLVRHKSLIDIITKISESSARINRAVAKSVTGCGCIKLSACKQSLPYDLSLDDISNVLTNQVEGRLCENCREVLEDEIGNNLYYISALSSALELNMDEALCKEISKINTLGKFRMR